MSTSNESDWIKIDLHIHTLDDPKDAVDFSALNYWNGRALLDFAYSRLPCTMQSLIERKCSPMRRQWAFC